MSNRFSNAAAKETCFSPLVEGKVKVDTDDIIKKYPDGVTIVGFDFAEGVSEKGESEEYPIIVIKEDPGIFFFGGTVLYKICKRWVEMEDDTVENVSANLAAEGGCKVILRKSKTKNNRNVTAVDIVE